MPPKKRSLSKKNTSKSPPKKRSSTGTVNSYKNKCKKAQYLCPSCNKTQAIVIGTTCMGDAEIYQCNGCNHFWRSDQ